MSKRLGPTPEPNSLDSGSDYICYQGEPGNALNISMPQFPHLKMGMIRAIFEDYHENQMRYVE